jgi:anaerobic magnesium-protoporphyrin IX monomethyl ester cyclase
MNIILIRPVIENKKRIYSVHPISLGYLATSLRKDHNVTIFDGENNNASMQGLLDVIRHQKPGLVGITVFSHNKIAVQNSIQSIKQALPETVIVLGGPHINAAGEKAFTDFPSADLAIAGEAEDAVSLLAGCIERGERSAYNSIPGLIYRDTTGKTQVNKPVFEENISRFDPFSYDIMGITDYFKGLPQGVFRRHRELASIITSRGCPYPCTFCAASINNGKIMRYRNVDNVIEEIELLSSKYGVREVHILDDNFTFSADYVTEFCDKLSRKKLNIDLALPNGIRLDKITEPLLRLMRASGFYALSFGIESGSEETLKKIRKLETTVFMRQQLELAKKYGFRITGTFIIGFPWETKKDIYQTLAFAKSLPLDHAAFGNFTPLPGTEITQDMIASGELSPDFCVPFTWGDITYAPKTIPADELKRLQRYCVFHFYIPARIFKILQSLKWSNIIFMLKRALLLFR